MQGIGKRITEARRKARFTQGALAKLIGVSDAAVSQWETEKHQPKRQMMANLAQALGVTVQWLENGNDNPSPQNGHNAPMRSEALQPFTRDLPVLGAARGGQFGSGQFVDNGTFFEMVQRPATLSNVANAYAVYIVDDSMAPRYWPGEMAAVNPNKPVLPGSYVCLQIETEDGEMDYLIKRLVRRSGGQVRVEQHNPQKEFDIDAKTVRAMHEIVVAGDLS